MHLTTKGKYAVTAALDLAMHENAREIQLDLKTHVHVGTVDGGAPPQRESSIWNLIQTTALGIGQLFKFHRFFKTTGLFPKQTFPRRKVRAFEQRVFQNPFDPTQCLNHVRAVIVEVPQLAVVALVRPPKRVGAKNAVFVEFQPCPPAFVVGQRVPVFLKQRVDPRNSTVPRIFQIFQRQPSVLTHGLLPLQGVLRPDALAVNELAFPRHDVTVQIGDHLILFVAHATSKMSDAAGFGLFRVPQITLWNQNVPHADHAQPTQFFRGVKHDGWKAAGHFTVQTNFDAGLDLILATDQQIQQFGRVDHCFPVVRHQ